jgi:hypothetical protein
MKTLTLDISTHTGWALLDGDSILESGTIHLATEDELLAQRHAGKERTIDLRFARLYHFIIEAVVGKGVSRIVFEDVLFSSTQMQGQLWASLRTAIWAVAQVCAIDSFGVPVGTLKLFATGNGAAKKPEMAHALAALEPESRVEENGEAVFLHRKGIVADDNEVDALWLARYTMAVDKGQCDFLGIYQRKLAEKAELRRKKTQRKADARAKQAAAKLAEVQKAKDLKSAIKAAGKCCGCFREATPGGKAKCLKCGTSIKLLKTPAATLEQAAAVLPTVQPVQSAVAA